MSNSKSLFAFALLAPLLGTVIPAEAQKKDVNAIRAECFRQANEAATAGARNMTSGASAARNALGYSAYRSCAKKNGIRP
jgi:hypothetical protein